MAARPVKIQDNDILNAAREVFMDMGATATTAAVAEKAGISEGTIFKRFSSKEDLFFAAMMSDDGTPEFVEQFGNLLEQSEPREAFYQAGLLALNFFRVKMPLSMMQWSNPVACPQQIDASESEPAPIRSIRSVVKTLCDEIERKRIRPVDPEILGRGFFGAIAHFASMEIMFKDSNAHSMDGEKFVRGLVDVLFSGLDPN